MKETEKTLKKSQRSPKSSKKDYGAMKKKSNKNTLKFLFII